MRGLNIFNPPVLTSTRIWRVDHTWQCGSSFEWSVTFERVAQNIYCTINSCFCVLLRPPVTVGCVFKIVHYGCIKMHLKKVLESLALCFRAWVSMWVRACVYPVYLFIYLFWFHDIIYSTWMTHLNHSTCLKTAE